MSIKITCSKCKAEKGVTPDCLSRLTNKFGSAAELKDKYVCRTCRGDKRRADLEVVKKEQAVKAAAEPVVEDKPYELPAHLKNWDRNASKTFSTSELKNPDTCLRPDIILGQKKESFKGYCNSCNYWSNCEYVGKRWYGLKDVPATAFKYVSVESEEDKEDAKAKKK
jgi:hypothetical protein